MEVDPAVMGSSAVGAGAGDLEPVNLATERLFIHWKAKKPTTRTTNRPITRV